MITFEQAREIVAEKRGGRYGPGANFQVLENGWQTADRWIVEWMSDAIDSGPWTSVDKETGEYFEDSLVEPYPFPDRTPAG